MRFKAQKGKDDKNMERMEEKRKEVMRYAEGL